MKKEFLDMFYEKVKDENGKNRIQAIALPMTMIRDKAHSSGKYIFEKFGLTQSEMDMIVTLYMYKGGLTAAEVSERMVFSSGGISKVVKKLEFKNLIYKKESLEDKRSFLLYITDKAKDIVEECMPKFEAHENKFFDVLNETEKEILEKALKKVLYALAEN